MVTLRTIAKLCGVSESTVSRALRDDQRISPSTRAKVQRIAREAGHTNNRLARSLALNRSYTIGLVMPPRSAAWFHQLSTAIADRFEALGYAVIQPVCEGPQALKYLAETMIDGVIIRGDGLFEGADSEQRDLLKRILERIPVVTVSARIPELSVPWVDVDRSQAIEEAVDLLYDIGHRRILYLGRVESTRRTTQAKIAGYVRAMQKRKLSTTLVHCKLTQTEAFAATDAALAHKPTAVIAESDDVAMGFLGGCWHRGVRVPDDVSLIGYDNTFDTATLASHITTVGPDGDAMAEAIVRILKEQIEARTERSVAPTDSTSNALIPIKWRHAKSVGPPP